MSSVSSVKATCLSAAVSALVLLTISGPVLAEGLEREVGAGRLNWSEGTLTVTGSGATKPGGNPGQQRLLAQRAAITDAYRQLAESVNGVQVFSETVVKDFVTESDTIRLSVSAVIRGAKPIGKPRYLSDGTVEVDVAMPIFGRGSLAQALDFGQAIQAEVARPYSSLENYLAFRGLRLERSKTHPGPRLAQKTDYTGLIIDASGLAAEPAMGPFIV
ncbi:MAG: LPP20 family lipoprotein, partial [Candidatus Sericytochromatia bacterium]